MGPKDESEFSRFYRMIGAAVISSTMVSLVCYPLDTLKKTAQTNGGRGFFNNYANTLDILRRVPTQLGYGAMYRGAHLYFMSNMIASVA